MIKPFLLAACAAAVSPPALAQQSAQPQDQLLQTLEDLRVPLHSAPADPLGGDYGLWAGGTGYKASFHDGFVFYPVLGANAPRHLPLRWGTDSMPRTVRAPPEWCSRCRTCRCSSAISSASGSTSTTPRVRYRCGLPMG